MNGRIRIPSPWLTMVALIGLVVIGAPAPADALLTYTLYGSLLKPACVGDGDRDCLDDSLEQALAWVAAPWYFFDEDESCNIGTHFARRDFFQVRPRGTDVGSWSPTDGRSKWVNVTYFFNYPHDCGLGSHAGDSENIRFYFYSYNLRTWYLSGATFWRHNRAEYVSGNWLADRAAELGTSWASVAADEDKHGSWQGKSVLSDHCAGSGDNFCFSTCDCFDSWWFIDFHNGRATIPTVDKNIGGPGEENWRPAVLSVAGETAWSWDDTGHGLNREYWWNPPTGYQKFCGWECPAVYKLTNGDCALNAHGTGSCASGLHEKVDQAYFTVGAPGACISNCVPEELEAKAAQASLTPETWKDLVKSDPIASQLPSLYAQSDRDRRAAVEWMLSVGDPRRLAYVFEDLGKTADRDLETVGLLAQDRLLALLDEIPALEARSELNQTLIPARHEWFPPKPNTVPVDLLLDALDHEDADSDEVDFLRLVEGATPLR